MGCKSHYSKPTYSYPTYPISLLPIGTTGNKLILAPILPPTTVGTTGNKAKVILAPMLAACGIKCPILSARGVVSFGGVLGKLATIPGFTAKRSFKDIRLLLSTIGLLYALLCVEPRYIASFSYYCFNIAKVYIAIARRC